MLINIALDSSSLSQAFSISLSKLRKCACDFAFSFVIRSSNQHRIFETLFKDSRALDNDLVLHSSSLELVEIED